MSELGELQQAIAAEHGLPPEAAAFLTGATIEAVEASAVALGKLLGAVHVSEEPPADREPDFFTVAVAAKAERQQALVDAITGRVPQRRDARGRFAIAGGSFDGGARQPVSGPPPSHDEWLSDVLRHRRADVGSRF